MHSTSVLKLNCLLIELFVLVQIKRLRNSKSYKKREQILYTHQSLENNYTALIKNHGAISNAQFVCSTQQSIINNNLTKHQIEFEKE